MIVMNVILLLLRTLSNGSLRPTCLMRSLSLQFNFIVQVHKYASIPDLATALVDFLLQLHWDVLAIYSAVEMSPLSSLHAEIKGA